MTELHTKKYKTKQSIGNSIPKAIFFQFEDF
jgi:hypothetical protein